MDYETIMQANLELVFGDRDPARRIEAIRELYGESADLHEPQRSVRGHDAINRAVTELLAQMPAEFTFTAIRPALALNRIARLQWRAGPPEGPAAATGTDVAHFEDGRIRSLYVFVDQPGT
jgi:SnoaL-like protein